MAKIKNFVFNDFGVNAFIVYDKTKEAVIIDGAANSERELNQLTGFIKDNLLTPKYIISTHGHIDHICGNTDLKAIFNIPVLMNSEDNFWVERAVDQAAMYGITIKKPLLSDSYLNDGDIVEFGNTKLKVLHIPGHSPGSIAFYIEDDDAVITGDTLFMGSIGRTDFPMGNHQQLLENIRTKLFTLPEDTLVLPGHGPETTIRDEKKYNTFLKK